MRIKIETVQDVIVATAILHNIAIDFNEELPPDAFDVVVQPEVPEVIGTEVDRRDNVRSVLLADYFPALLQQRMDD